MTSRRSDEERFMRTWRRWTRLSAVLATAVLLASGAASAQTQPKPECDRARTPEKVDAQVVKVDARQGKITVREDNGRTHEFQASKETLQDLKPGDRIEATLRSC
jgi:Cu/Ag efflux protein CusF